MLHRHLFALAVLIAATPLAVHGARAASDLGLQPFPAFDTAALCAGRPDGHVLGDSARSPCVTIESGARTAAEADWTKASDRDQRICTRQAVERGLTDDAELAVRSAQRPGSNAVRATGATPGSYLTLTSCLNAHRRMEQAGLL